MLAILLDGYLGWCAVPLAVGGIAAFAWRAHLHDRVESGWAEWVEIAVGAGILGGPPVAADDDRGSPDDDGAADLAGIDSGAEPVIAEPDGAEPDGAELDGAELDGAEPDGAEPDRAEPDRAELAQPSDVPG